MSLQPTTRRGPAGPRRVDSHPHLYVVRDLLHDGMLFRLECGPPFRVGRSPESDLLIPDLPENQSVSRNHAELELRTDGMVELRDRRSSNGTFVDDARVEETVLRDGARILLGSAVKLRVDWLTEEEAHHRSAAFRDKLTGCYQRRRFDLDLAEQHARCALLGRPLSLVVLDIDHFGQVNKDHGFQCGDAVLQEVALRVCSAAGETLDGYRLGGEEFAVLMPGLGLSEAVALAEAIRADLESTTVRFEGRELGVTGSLGCASHVPEERQRPGTLLGAADACLRRAKQGGRNRVEPRA